VLTSTEGLAILKEKEDKKFLKSAGNRAKKKGPRKEENRKGKVVKTEG